MQVEEQDNVEQPLVARDPQPGRSPVSAGQPKRRWMMAMIAFAIVAAVVISGIVPRVRAVDLVRPVAVPRCLALRPAS